MVKFLKIIKITYVLLENNNSYLPFMALQPLNASKSQKDGKHVLRFAVGFLHFLLYQAILQRT